MELVGRRLPDHELRAVLDDPDVVAHLLFGDDAPGPDLDLGKAWHGLHYLLTGAREQVEGDFAGAAVLGGDEIGDDDGYGPARVLGPHLVRAVAAGLDVIEADSLRDRYDPRTMRALDIYPDSWQSGELHWLVTQFGELRRFYRIAAERGQAVLLTLV